MRIEIHPVAMNAFGSDNRMQDFILNDPERQRRAEGNEAADLKFRVHMQQVVGDDRS